MKGIYLRITIILLPLLTLLACNPPDNPGTADIQILQGSAEITSGGSYDFGGVAIGASSTPVTFTIKNAGTAPASLSDSSALTITGSNAADFAISTHPSLTIAAGASTTFALVFSPSVVAAENVALSLSSDAGTYSFTINGTGTYSGTIQLEYNGDGWLNLSNGDTMSFPYMYGSGTQTLTVQITNIHATQPLVLVGATPLTITNSTGAFSITSSPTSPVAPDGGVTSFDIQEAYIASGTWNETVTLKTSDPTNPTFTFSVSGSQS